MDHYWMHVLLHLLQLWELVCINSRVSLAYTNKDIWSLMCSWQCVWQTLHSPAGDGISSTVHIRRHSVITQKMYFVEFLLQMWFRQVVKTLVKVYFVRQWLSRNCSVSSLRIMVYASNTNKGWKCKLAILFAEIWYDIYLLTAIGLTASGSSTRHIYTQTVHRTTQWNRIPRTEHT